ncbi:hypothetical protein Pmani_028302 [Petrolisthes manimaculis]|uniref:Uncharacterized protein n=1 Tax=Petrolisthes manimaculis TaxID=1843537 RepID=A0AAE1P1D6_9EUCA|nr:hypothetical protein Pmani_028302 [Petrolisthes manimaculis]
MVPRSAPPVSRCQPPTLLLSAAVGWPEKCQPVGGGYDRLPGGWVSRQTSRQADRVQRRTENKQARWREEQRTSRQGGGKNREQAGKVEGRIHGGEQRTSRQGGEKNREQAGKVEGRTHGGEQ